MITLYSTGCPKCKVLKAKLDSKGIEYETCSDIDLMRSMNIMCVPQLDTGDGKLLSFSEANEWVNGQ